MKGVLSSDQITKTIESKFALGPLDLPIERGYIVAVVGPNGSGKTTLFRMLMDRLPTSSENIRGIVAVEQDPSIKLISDSPQETLHGLTNSGINVIKTQSVDLGEIFMHLLHRNNLLMKREGN